MHPYNLIHQNFATVNTLPLIDSWLVLVSCSIDELRQTRLEEAIKSGKNKDSLTIPLAINYEWVSNHFGDDTATEGARHFWNETWEDNISACKTGRQTDPHWTGEAKWWTSPTKKWRQHRGNRDLGGKLFTVQGTSVCRALFKHINIWKKMFNTSRQKYRLEAAGNRFSGNGDHCCS